MQSTFLAFTLLHGETDDDFLILWERYCHTISPLVTMSIPHSFNSWNLLHMQSISHDANADILACDTPLSSLKVNDDCTVSSQKWDLVKVSIGRFYDGIVLSIPYGSI